MLVILKLVLNIFIVYIIHVQLRVYTMYICIYRHLGTKTSCLNLGSYNYLGFAESTGPCADAAYQSTLQYGAGTCSPAKELGMYSIHVHVHVRVCIQVMYVFVHPFSNL